MRWPTAETERRLIRSGGRWDVGFVGTVQGYYGLDKGSARRVAAWFRANNPGLVVRVSHAPPLEEERHE